MAAPLRRRPKDPEGRMPLREHLRELRNRLLKAGVAILVGAVIGWFLYPPVFEALMRPIYEIARAHPDRFVSVNFAQVSSPFNLQLKLSFYIGFVISSPIWLYQLWAFIVPGLTRREKRYSLGFVAVAVPLFLTGLGLAWLVLPNAVRFLTEFTPKGGSNIIVADDYLTFVLRIMLAFGLAFVTPLLLVALNLVGILSARALAKGWRVAVFLCFLFAAIASPTPDAGSMLALAFPMVALYLIAVGIAFLNDRRKATRAAAEGWGDLSDEEASPLDDDAGFDSYDHEMDTPAGDGPPRP
jgi:sec-independent protein translocase protein TatC